MKKSLTKNNALHAHNAAATVFSNVYLKILDKAEKIGPMPNDPQHVTEARRPAAEAGLQQVAPNEVTIFTTIPGSAQLPTCGDKWMEIATAGFNSERIMFFIRMHLLSLGLLHGLKEH